MSWVDERVNTIPQPFRDASSYVSQLFAAEPGGVPTGGGRSGGRPISARAEGGPISRGATYLTGENGHELSRRHAPATSIRTRSARAAARSST